MLRKSVLAGVSLSLFALSAEAQVSRVFVSVDGNDANTCSNVATPCRTIAGGVAQVDAQGEVIITTSGSYAGGTINKAVKVNAASGVVAFSGLPIVVDPGGVSLVVIRGMTIKAVTLGVGTGIALNSGRLSVEGCVLDGWERGIEVGTSAQRLYVENSTLRNITGTGIYVAALGAAQTVIENTRFLNFYNNYSAYLGQGSSTATISGCEISGVYGGIWNYDTSEAFVDNCRISSAANGLYITTNATMRVSRTIVTRNTVIGAWNNGGTFVSSGNNVFRGNTTDTMGTITVLALQ